MNARIEPVVFHPSIVQKQAAAENLNYYRNGAIAMLCDLALNTPNASLETLADIRRYLDLIEAAIKGDA